MLLGFFLAATAAGLLLDIWNPCGHGISQAYGSTWKEYERTIHSLPYCR